MISQITNVWTEVLTWFTTNLPKIEELFVVKNAGEVTGLTLMGTFSLIGVAIGIVFLVIGVIQNFVHLRG